MPETEARVGDFKSYVKMSFILNNAKFREMETANLPPSELIRANKKHTCDTTKVSRQQLSHHEGGSLLS